MNNLTEVKFISDRKGRGLFAKKDIEKGKTVDIAHLVLISNKEWRLIKDTILSRYTFEWDDPKCKGKYESAISLSVNQFINHSYTPNVEYSYNYKNKSIKYTAIRKISKGEEITVNYNGYPCDNSPVGFRVE
ncbi:MAG: SET domain-containing protein-lysine N-methyltransferase [Candidatus Hermodarchaeota archaeon]